MTEEKTLIEEAFAARNFAYAPYSRFQVGAALLGKSGKIYQGCNIENAAYGPSNCAERTAFFKAISEGEQEFLAIAIVGGPEGIKREEMKLCAPCGVCRQVMIEFCDPASFLIFLFEGRENIVRFTLGELLPVGFGRGNVAQTE